MASLDKQLLDLLDDFKPIQDSPSRNVRRPAGDRVLIETIVAPSDAQKFQGLAHFWMDALHEFLGNSGSDIRWFEGLIFQSTFTELSSLQFYQEFHTLQQAHLTLPPPETIQLVRAYRMLQGRLVSYLGITIDHEYWSGTLGPFHFGAEQEPY